MFSKIAFTILWLIYIVGLTNITCLRKVCPVTFRFYSNNLYSFAPYVNNKKFRDFAIWKAKVKRHNNKKRQKRKKSP
jgi:hypothetical protein